MAPTWLASRFGAGPRAVAVLAAVAAPTLLALWEKRGYYGRKLVKYLARIEREEVAMFFTEQLGGEINASAERYLAAHPELVKERR